MSNASGNGVLTNMLPKRPRRILVANGKGGCGKTTIATNLAGHYASLGEVTALLDYDPQGSSMQWLSLRQDGPPIHGVAAHRRSTSQVTRSWAMRLPLTTERVILDAPAGVHGQELIELVREVDTIIIPVLPSPIDIHAASRFIEELLIVAKVRARSIRMGVVANRVRENHRVYQALERFLQSLSIPFAAQLRDSQGYVHAAELGLALSEMPQPARRDLNQWEALIRWVEGGELPQAKPRPVVVAEPLQPVAVVPAPEVRAPAVAALEKTETPVAEKRSSRLSLFIPSFLRDRNWD